MASSSSLFVLRRLITSSGGAASPSPNLILNSKKFLQRLIPLHGIHSFSQRDTADNNAIKFSNKEEKDGLHMKLTLPGFGKEDVKVYFKNDTQTTKLIIEQKTGKYYNEDGQQRPLTIYTHDLKRPDLYNTDQIRADIKNGLLNVFLPKLKEEEINKIEDVLPMDLLDDQLKKLESKEESEHNNNVIAKSDLLSHSDSAPSLFSDEFDDVFPKRNKLDRPWKLEHEEGVYVSINMPGLGREDIKVSLETGQSFLFIKELVGDNSRKDNDDVDETKTRRRCIKLNPAELYDGDQTIAEMKNGVLRVLIPILNWRRLVHVEVKGE